MLVRGHSASFATRLKIAGQEADGPFSLQFFLPPGGPHAFTNPGPLAFAIPGNATTTEIIGVPGSRSSIIDFAGDTDWFKVTLTAGQTYQFFLIGSQSGGTQPNTLANPFLRVLDGSGNPWISMSKK